MKTLITGNATKIAKLLATCDRVTVDTRFKDPTVRLEWGSDEVHDRHMAELDTNRMDSHQRQAALCKAQLNAFREGWMPMSLSDNMYGYSVCSHVASNIRGGRASLTMRGLTLEEAIEWGIVEVASLRPGATFTLSAANLPDEVLSALVDEAPETYSAILAGYDTETELDKHRAWADEAHAVAEEGRRQRCAE